MLLEMRDSRRAACISTQIDTYTQEVYVWNQEDATEMASRTYICRQFE
jgi:hypothetical protein